MVCISSRREDSCFYDFHHKIPLPLINCSVEQHAQTVYGGFCMDSIKERVIRLAEYIVENGATVREAATAFGISKSTVHKDMTGRLSSFDPLLFEDVRRILERNKAERHIRGGLATRQKYLVLQHRKREGESNTRRFSA